MDAISRLVAKNGTGLSEEKMQEIGKMMRKKLEKECSMRQGPRCSQDQNKYNFMCYKSHSDLRRYCDDKSLTNCTQERGCQIMMFVVKKLNVRFRVRLQHWI
jgi:hypothetical protein